MHIKKGFATWAGVIAAAGQYAGAVALFLEADDQALAIAPLVTATGVLWKVIEGRMNQATAAIQNPAPAPAAPVVYGTTGGSSGTVVTSTFTTPRPGAELRTVDPGPSAWVSSIPAGSVPVSTEAPQ